MDPRILWKLSYGVYAVCGQKDGVNFGCIANSAMQVTAEPASIAVSINHDNFTHGCLTATGRFALCILPESYPPLASWAFTAAGIQTNLPGWNMRRRMACPF